MKDLIAWSPNRKKQGAVLVRKGSLVNRGRYLELLGNQLVELLQKGNYPEDNLFDLMSFLQRESLLPYPGASPKISEAGKLLVEENLPLQERLSEKGLLDFKEKLAQKPALGGEKYLQELELESWMEQLLQ